MFLMHQIGRNETNKQVSWLIIRNVGENNKNWSEK